MNAVGLGQDLAPGRDDEAVAVGLPAALVLAGLRRGKDEAAVLDGAGAHQHMPVRRAGLARERGRDGQEIRAGLGQRAIEVGKAQIVADGQAQRTPGQLGQHAGVCRPGSSWTRDSSRRPAVRTSNMWILSKRASTSPLGRDQQRAVGDLAVAEQDGHRADVQPDAELAREAAEVGDRRIALLGPDSGEQARPLGLHQRGDLGGLHVLRALPGRLADRARWRRPGSSPRCARAHLHEADAEVPRLLLSHRAASSRSRCRQCNASRRAHRRNGQA